MAGQTAKPSKGRSLHGKQPAGVIEPALSNGESESDTSETVDDEGMEKLMKALGEDGLNEFDLAQLHTLAGDDEGDEGSSDESEDGEQGGEEVVDGGDSDGEDIALDDEDVDSVDEDAVPRRKIAIDNTVRPIHCLSLAISSNIISWIGCSRTHTRHYKTGSIASVD